MNDLFPIEIIYFDTKSELEMGEFPISRSYYAELIEIVEKQNPKYIVLKFFFDQERVEDTVLFDVIEKYKNVLTQSTTYIDSEVEYTDYLSIQKTYSIEMNIENSNQLLIPNKNLINGFDGVGLVDFRIENSNYYDFPLFGKVDDTFIPSLATLILLKESDTELKYADDYISLGDIDIAHSNGYMRIDLSKPKDLYPTHSMIDILNKDSETDFNNKIIIVFIENEMVRNVKSSYDEMHNKAEIVADSINTILKRINRR